jgi:hypothetical protein
MATRIKEGAMRRRTLLTTAAAAALASPARAADKTVVLELFTSQGCSDCPPADAYLGELARRPGVIALAWHIDYWDNLGWRDPFASRLSTDRQKAYAGRLEQVVFTPALVIDGTAMVIGSQRPNVEAAISTASPLPVSISLTRTPDGMVADIGAADAPVRALLASYDPEQATDVRAGENDGARLREYRIVRDAKVLAEWDGSARRLIAPPVPPGRGAALLLQSAALRVLGAADLPPSPTG